MEFHEREIRYHTLPQARDTKFRETAKYVYSLSRAAASSWINSWKKIKESSWKNKEQQQQQQLQQQQQQQQLLRTFRFPQPWLLVNCSWLLVIAYFLGAQREIQKCLVKFCLPMFGKVLPPKGLVKTSRESFVKNRHVKKAHGNELVKPSRESSVITYHGRDTWYVITDNPLRYYPNRVPY